MDRTPKSPGRPWDREEGQRGPLRCGARHHHRRTAVGGKPALSSSRGARPHRPLPLRHPCPLLQLAGSQALSSPRVPIANGWQSEDSNREVVPTLGVNRSAVANLKFVVIISLNLCFVRGGLWDGGAPSCPAPAQQTPTPHSLVGARPGHEGHSPRQQPHAEGT